MQGYIIHFFAYTMAMAGFFAVCLFIYKKLCIQGFSSNKTDFLKIENGVRINARKQIFVVRAGEERFLVASDYDRTTLLAKLDTSEDISAEKTVTLQNTAPQNIHLSDANILNFASEDRENIAPALKRINNKMKA